MVWCDVMWTFGLNNVQLVRGRRELGQVRIKRKLHINGIIIISKIRNKNTNNN